MTKIVEAFETVGTGVTRPIRFELNQAASSTAGNGSVPIAQAAYAVAVESGCGVTHQTVITLAALPQAVTTAGRYQGTKIYDFPEGVIGIQGCVVTVAQTTTSAILSTINGGSTGAVSVGSTTAASTTLNSTAANMVASTAFTSSTVINVAGTAVGAALAAGTQLDGHTTPVAVYLNTAFVTAGDVDADGTQALSGTVTLTWVNLGDY